MPPPCFSSLHFVMVILIDQLGAQQILILFAAINHQVTLLPCNRSRIPIILQEPCQCYHHPTISAKCGWETCRSLAFMSSVAFWREWSLEHYPCFHSLCENKCGLWRGDGRGGLWWLVFHSACSHCLYVKTIQSDCEAAASVCHPLPTLFTLAVDW